MSDYRVINRRSETTVKLPSGYDKGYRKLILPYDYQNVDASAIEENARTILNEISKGIESVTELQWIRTSSTEFFPNELDHTFEKDILNEYGELIQECYGLGNWDVTINPNITVSGNGYSIEGESILYPQCGLFWNSFYNKYFAVWYTPIQRFANNSIISKSQAETYIRQLSTTSGYLLNDIKGIILRVSDELGFSPIDVLSVNETPTPRVSRVLNELPLWSETLTKVQLKYQKLKQICENIPTSQYLFLDEDTSLFSPIRKSYFVFKVEQNYFEDLVDDWDLKEPPEKWSASKGYKAGEYVLGIGQKNKNYIYRCATTHTAEEAGGQFEEKIVVQKKLSNEEGTYDEVVDRWTLVTTEYAKEIQAITEAKADFNPNNYIRFAFPALEDTRPVEYYTNGAKKPSSQHGRVRWGKEGITLRPIYHRYIKEADWVKACEYNADKDDEHKINPKVSTLINYSLKMVEDEATSAYPKPEGYKETDLAQMTDPYITDSDDIDYNDEDSTPTDSEVTFYDCSRKIIHYFPKSSLPFTFSMIIECKIRSIINEAFAGREDLLKTVLRSSIKSIESEAFYNCENLEQAVLPQSLTGLGIKAFAACKKLKRASIPPEVTRIDSCYIGCENLQTVTLPDNLEELGDYSFTNCTSLEYVYNISHIKRIGVAVFNNCPKLKEITIPEAVTELPGKLFKGCKEAKITIMNTAPTLIGESCFEGCEKITEALSFANVKELYPSTYKNCINLKSINFNFNLSNNGNEETPEEDKVKPTVPHHFCYGCYKLTNVNLGQVTSLGDSSFQNCAILSEVTIPNTVTEVGAYVFYDCFRLGRVNVPSSIGYGSWIEKVLNSTNRTNWIDPLFTRVVSGGVTIRWQPTTI